MPNDFAGHTLSISASERHDRICDRFELGCHAGQPPNIEDLLVEVPEPERRALLIALLRVDLHYHTANPTSLDEYRARFPAYAELIESVFRDPQATWAVFPTGPQGDPTPPEIAGYEVTGMLGVGGMGVVFHGRHIGLDRPVAIKTLKEGACQPNHLLRFHLEAQAVASLSHPNVVTLFDSGQSNALPYFVMEFVDGGSLAARLDGNAADPKWVAGIVEPLARAMQYVHERHILHRDLKPANILLAADGTPKITDFGLAKRLVGDEPGVTQSHTVMGSACYMSPEQARGDHKAIDRRSDVYSLGAILYECLTGRPPFLAANYQLTIVQVLTEDPPRPAELVVGLPADLEAICLKCLEKDPAQRYQSAAELADDLALYRDDMPPKALPLSEFDRDAKVARRIGYKIVEALGKTPKSHTYLARQPNIKRSLQLSLSTGKIGTPAHAALQLQAEALSGLEHPNLIRLIHYDEQAGQPYLTLEYVEEGESLRRWLRNQKYVAGVVVEGPPTSRHKALGPDFDIGQSDGAHAPVPAREAGELALQLALGLQAIHDNAVLHCGIHTGDIVMTKEDGPKIGNFAAARRASRPANASAQDPEWVWPNYQSPEVMAGAWAQVRPASDIYSLGAVLYDLLAGGPPFSAPTDAETRNKVRTERPQGPIRAEPELDAIVLKCLEKSPERRYLSAGALALALQRFLKSLKSRSDDSSGRDSTIFPVDPAVPDRTARLRLRIESGPKLVGNTFDIPRDRIMVGRAKGNEVYLPDAHRHISRVHCGIIWNEEAAYHEITHYGGPNGTFVNGERLKGNRRLSPGDCIRIAGYELYVEPVSE